MISALHAPKSPSDVAPLPEHDEDNPRNEVSLVVDPGGLFYRTYRNEEEDLAQIMALVEQELSEP